MMKKGVMTVYFSLVFMLVMSFLLVLLESDRLYILRTEGERYADMAAEMVFAGYIQPLADYYSLFGVNHGEKNSQLEKFDDYYEKGYIDRVITTNLTYLPAEAKEKPYFLIADMSKFIALIIDSMNHDISIGKVMDPTEKIHRLLAKHNTSL